MMLLAVFLSMCPALSMWHVMLHRRIHNYLFGNGVAGELPDELVAPALLVFIVAGVDNLIVILMELSVVVGDGFGE